MSGKKFETSLQKLEKIVSEMESGELSLDDSLKYFEEGTELSKTCYSLLDDAEQKISKLTKGIVRPQEEDEL